MPTHDFQQQVTLLQTESERFAQYLDTLTPEAWSQPSACGQWQVQDVVAHLVGVAEFYADNISRGLKGDAAPPPGRPPAGSITAAMAAAGVAQRALDTRKQLGDRLLTAFKTTNDHLNRLLAELPPGTQATPCYHPGGIVQARQFADLRLKELTMHEWDIRSRLDARAPLSRPGLQAIIRSIDEVIASGSLRWAFHAGDKLPAPIRYRFELTGAVPYRTDLVVEGDTVRQEPVSAMPADVTFRCQAETFALLIYGRLSVETARHEGRLTVAGREELATTFTQWFKGI